MYILINVDIIPQQVGVGWVIESLIVFVVSVSLVAICIAWSPNVPDHAKIGSGFPDASVLLEEKLFICCFPQIIIREWEILRRQNVEPGSS